MQPGQSRYFVSTMGLPGQEKVVSVSRQEYYQTGKFPTVDTIEGALKENMARRHGRRIRADPLADVEI